MAQTLNVFLICGTVISMTVLILLSLPDSKLRSICLEVSKYALAAGLALLVISPIDPIPDVLFPIGFLDDLGYLAAAFAAIKSAQQQRKERELIA